MFNSWFFQGRDKLPSASLSCISAFCQCFFNSYAVGVVIVAGAHDGIAAPFPSRAVAGHGVAEYQHGAPGGIFVRDAEVGARDVEKAVGTGVRAWAGQRLDRLGVAFQHRKFAGGAVQPWRIGAASATR